MNLLQKFYADFQVKAEVKAFLIEHLEDLAIKRSFNGEDTRGIKEAKLIIDKAFKDLDRQFDIKTQKKPTSNR